MTVDARDLLGGWRLISWSLVYEDGRPDEYPLGADALGSIMYTPDGCVAATLMRARRPREAPSTDAGRAEAYTESFAYAGRYQVRDATVYHSIEIATNPALIGMTSTRHIAFDGDLLVLSGPDFAAGTARMQKIIWRRATGH